MRKIINFINNNRTQLLFAAIIVLLAALVFVFIHILTSSSPEPVPPESEFTVSETDTEKVDIGTVLDTDTEPDVPENTADTSSVSDTLPEDNRLSLDNMVIGDTEWAYFIVNRSNFVPDGYDSDIDFRAVQGYYLDARVADYAEAMINDAADDGVSLLICSAYRSYSRQRTNFENRLKDYAIAKYPFASAYANTAAYIAVPGTSEHQTGLAIDFISPEYMSLDEGFERTRACEWLNENSYKYGFILRYPVAKSELTGINYEPWHFRFIGFEHAEKIYESGLCLEEYMAQDKANGADIDFNELGPLAVPAEPAWYDTYVNPPEPDSSESDSTAPDSAESDSTESDSTEADSTEADSTESDSAEPDSAESDSTEPDRTESDSTESDSAESDSTEPDSTEPDSTEPDSTEPDSAESNSAEPDSTESDSAESDSAESDSTESDSTESDSTESDSTESDSAESDSAESDSTESDSAELDSTEPDSAESDSTEPDSAETANIETDEAGEDVTDEALDQNDDTDEIIYGEEVYALCLRS